MNVKIALTLLIEGAILHATRYQAQIDLVMSSNTIPPNSTQLLHRWCVKEAVSSENNRTHHAYGQNASNGFGISTSAIQAFDPVAMTVKTLSGKTYVLVGHPDNSPLGEAAWRKWCADNSIFAERDVTRDYYLNTDLETTVTFKRLKRGGFEADS
jgi:hypothetical protein